MTLAAYLLNRIARDPRLAYYFDPLSQSMEMLTETYAKEKGLDVEAFRNDYYPRLKFERPTCADCSGDL